MIPYKKKHLALVTVGSHVKIEFVEGGEIPKELAGLYTSKAAAQQAIATYISLKKVA